MALVNIGSIRQKTLKVLSKTDPPGGVELLSYKRNRSIAIICQPNETFLVKERGYIVQEVVSSEQELARLLKEMIKREFPRSRKVRMYQVDSPADLEKDRKKL